MKTSIFVASLVVAASLSGPVAAVERHPGANPPHGYRLAHGQKALSRATALDKPALRTVAATVPGPSPDTAWFGLNPQDCYHTFCVGE